MKVLNRSILSRSLIVSLMLFLTAGCTTIDPYTREKQISRLAIGATAGALAGGTVGLLAGSEAVAIIGVGVGALVGGGIGNYLDKQEARLRAELEETGVSVTRFDDRIVLNMPENIMFEAGRANIKPRFTRVLNSVVLVLEEFDETSIEVGGHTDPVGLAELNQILSERRAKAVGHYLQSQGIHPGRIMAVGYGETRPIHTNRTPEGRAHNRRVELSLSHNRH